MLEILLFGLGIGLVLVISIVNTLAIYKDGALDRLFLKPIKVADPVSMGCQHPENSVRYVGNSKFCSRCGEYI